MSSAAPTVLVTGGLGFIGSHTVVELAEAGFRSVIVDDLSNSSLDVLDRLASLCRLAPVFQRGDVRDADLLRSLLLEHPVDCAVHFAGLKAVGESVRIPLDYYSVNVGGTVSLMNALQERGVPKLVFSSSATVYGNPDAVPIPETHRLAPRSPYGRSKLMAEQVIQDACASDDRWSAVCLRYFNPAGAHPSALLGERPSGVPNNLMPYISQVGTGEREQLEIYGADYATSDGTGVRDYVHVVDLAQAHVRAITRVLRERGFEACNLGTGRGYSVFEVVRAYERANGVRIPYRMRARRDGDVDACVADPTQAAHQLGWRAVRSLDDMCRDAARFEQASRMPSHRTAEPA
ncbi:MAG: UDP-glucose 4-epimerase GalE [Pseudoxanthomonas sp.]